MLSGVIEEYDSIQSIIAYLEDGTWSVAYDDGKGWLTPIAKTGADEILRILKERRTVLRDTLARGA